MSEGRLIYVVGASGSGKDTLITYARDRLAGEAGVCFAHRYITRPANAGGENHMALSPAEFAARRDSGLFALHWGSHGLHYGIGVEINQWLARGLTVVVNGSRDYLLDAARRYPELEPVTIAVSTGVLRDRLLARGRETPDEIEARLARHEAMRERAWPGVVIHNDGSVEQAGEALVRLIRAREGVSACV
ncbi:phosphonate metabolism protein/1,5-bisphosphokinase (PRPP-forming) PhnN [Rhodocyclaceae bacterium SMB388]